MREEPPHLEDTLTDLRITCLGVGSWVFGELSGEGQLGRLALDDDGEFASVADEYVGGIDLPTTPGGIGIGGLDIERWHHRAQEVRGVLFEPRRDLVAQGTAGLEHVVV